jgi:NAD dependent epimerase/dehydratase family
MTHDCNPSPRSIVLDVTINRRSLLERGSGAPKASGDANAAKDTRSSLRKLAPGYPLREICSWWCAERSRAATTVTTSSIGARRIRGQHLAQAATTQPPKALQVSAFATPAGGAGPGGGRQKIPALLKRLDLKGALVSMTSRAMPTSPSRSLDAGGDYLLARFLTQCRAYREQHGCDFILAMPTNLYGPGDNFDLESAHVLPPFLRWFAPRRSPATPRSRSGGPACGAGNSCTSTIASMRSCKSAHPEL